MIATTAIRISPNSNAISLGRSRRNAERFSAAAIAPPPSSGNAPVMWKTSSQSYVSMARKPKGRGGYLQSPSGRDRAASAPADEDDRGGQLDARLGGGALARRARGRRRARRGCLLRLPLRRAGGRTRPAGDVRDAGRGDDRPSAHAARRGDHGRRG